jgi:regulator of RNase E activity RraA
VPLEIDDTIVRPGDLVVCDAINGVVVIPIDKLSDVLELLPRLTSADDQAKNAVTEGMSVSEAFRTFRDGR